MLESLVQSRRTHKQACWKTLFEILVTFKKERKKGHLALCKDLGILSKIVC